MDLYRMDLYREETLNLLCYGILAHLGLNVPNT